MKFSLSKIPLVVVHVCVCVSWLGMSIARAQSETEALRPIALNSFGSCISHWRNLRDENRFIHVEENQPSYQASQVTEIVQNILLFQRADGGWPKDYDVTAVLTPEQRARVMGTRNREDASYDNNNLFSQVEYLARAVHQIDVPEWRLGCEKGVDFIFRSQYSHGGFPQRFPKPHSYHAHVTFNDGVMIGILRVLQDAGNAAPHFQWLDQTRRKLAREAVERGIACILRCQIRTEGELSGWCQQHDEKTFAPRSARTFELASICPQETTAITRFLMAQQNPSPELVHSVDAAVAWLQRVALKGIRVEKVASTPESFLRHDTDFDVVVVNDSQAEPLWARHYEIGTDRPVFAGRDGVKKYALAEIERERRTGTPWYGGWPRALLESEYPRWKRDLSQRSSASE